MVDELTQQLAKLVPEVYVISPYYDYDRYGNTGYLEKDGVKWSVCVCVLPQGHCLSSLSLSCCVVGCVSVCVLWLLIPILFCLLLQEAKHCDYCGK